MRRLIASVIIILIFHSFCTAKQDIHIDLETNRKHVYLGESFILRVTVTGGLNADNIDLSKIKNCNIKRLGSRDISNYSLRMINGRITRQGTQRNITSYQITPSTSGVFKIAPVIINFDGQTLHKQGPDIEVTTVEKQDTVKINITASRKEVLVDEPFEVCLNIFIKALPNEYANIQPLFPNRPPYIEIPYIPNPGEGLKTKNINAVLRDLLVSDNTKPGMNVNDYTIQRHPFDSFFDFSGFPNEPQQAKFDLFRQTVITNNQQYFKYQLCLSYTPEEENDYVFGPVVFKGSIPVNINKQNNAVGKYIYAIGPATTVRVIPPPQEDRPPSYSGAIGTGLIVNAGLNTAECRQGDPIKLTLTVSGDVRLNNMLPPKLNMQTNLVEGFIVYQDTAKTITQKNSKEFIYTIRAKKPGSYSLPPIKVSYYNLKQRKYQTVKTSPIALNIRESKQITGSSIIGNTNQTSRAASKKSKPDKEISPITNNQKGASSGSLLPNSVYFVFGALGPVLILIVLLIKTLCKKNEMFRNARKRYFALRKALALIYQAEEMNNNNSAEAKKKLITALKQYVSERFDCKTDGITPSDITNILLKNNISAANAETCQNLFQQIFNCRFQNQSNPERIKSFCSRMRNVLQLINKNAADKTS
jgi:hypothetical protein